MQVNNTFLQLLKIAYPIIQAPMLGVTTPEMVAAISNCGGLGSLPVGGLSPEVTSNLIRKVKTLTNKPFAVNLFAHTIHQPDIKQAEAMRTFLESFRTKTGFDYTVPEISSLNFYSYKDVINVIIEENVPVVSFTFGIPDDETLQKLKVNKIVLIGTATCTQEAELLAEKNVDAIAAQGIEAGGHRGTFIEGVLPEIAIMALVPQIKKVTNIPVIACGAINSGATIKAAFSLGASAVQMGTVFIGCRESNAIAAYKKALVNSNDYDSKITRAFSGRWARGLRNEMMKLIEDSGLEIPPYPVMNSLTANLRAMAQRENDSRFTNLWTGQAPFATNNLYAKDILELLVADAEL